jgi:hypothetical protein
MMLQFGSRAEGLGKAWQPGQPRFNRVVFIGAPLCFVLPSLSAAAALCLSALLLDETTPCL